MTVTLIAVLIAADITALLGCIKRRINHKKRKPPQIRYYIRKDKGLEVITK